MNPETELELLKMKAEDDESKMHNATPEVESSEQNLAIHSTEPTVVVNEKKEDMQPSSEEAKPHSNDHSTAKDAKSETSTVVLEAPQSVSLNAVTFSDNENQAEDMKPQTKLDLTSVRPTRSGSNTPR